MPTYMHADLNAHTHTHTHIHTHIHTLSHIHAHTHTHTHKYTRTAMSCVAALTHDQPLAGCFILSGYLTLRNKIPNLLTDAGRATPFFQAQHIYIHLKRRLKQSSATLSWASVFSFHAWITCICINAHVRMYVSKIVYTSMPNYLH